MRSGVRAGASGEKSRACGERELEGLHEKSLEILLVGDDEDEDGGTHVERGSLRPATHTQHMHM